MVFEPYGPGKKSWPSKAAWRRELVAFRKMYSGFSESEIMREWHAKNLPEGFKLPEGLGTMKLSRKAMQPKRRLF